MGVALCCLEGSGEKAMQRLRTGHAFLLGLCQGRLITKVRSTIDEASLAHR